MWGWCWDWLQLIGIRTYKHTHTHLHTRAHRSHASIQIQSHKMDLPQLGLAETATAPNLPCRFGAHQRAHIMRIRMLCVDCCVDCWAGTFCVRVRANACMRARASSYFIADVRIFQIVSYKRTHTNTHTHARTHNTNIHTTQLGHADIKMYTCISYFVSISPASEQRRRLVRIVCVVRCVRSMFALACRHARAKRLVYKLIKLMYVWLCTIDNKQRV